MPLLRPSPQHQALAYAVPRLRKSRELDTVEAERARLERWHDGLDRTLPTRVVPMFDRRFEVSSSQVDGLPSYVVTPRGRTPRRTVFYVHGGGFIAPIDAFHVRYVTRLAHALDARVVLPDYPLAPEHTWRDSHAALVASAGFWAAAGPTVLAGDSAGGGLALALALSMRDAGGPRPSSLLLLSPWVDLTTSTPETTAFSAADPWLFLGKIKAYASFWAGSAADLGRSEVSPALGDLRGLPRALMFCGTRDTLVPGCRLLARRGEEAGWDLTYVEEPGLIHVYPLLPLVPEARRAFRQTVSFLC
jgi:monoterpene epsilon-lactone hydrolase